MDRFKIRLSRVMQFISVTLMCGSLMVIVMTPSEQNEAVVYRLITWVVVMATLIFCTK